MVSVQMLRTLPVVGPAISCFNMLVEMGLPHWSMSFGVCAIRTDLL